jgi:hypothetical protein
MHLRKFIVVCVEQSKIHPGQPIGIRAYKHYYLLRNQGETRNNPRIKKAKIKKEGRQKIQPI